MTFYYFHFKYCFISFTLYTVLFYFDFSRSVPFVYVQFVNFTKSASEITEGVCFSPSQNWLSWLLSDLCGRDFPWKEFKQRRPLVEFQDATTSRQLPMTPPLLHSQPRCYLIPWTQWGDYEESEIQTQDGAYRWPINTFWRSRDTRTLFDRI